jgi:hypothetical protein
LGSDPSKVNNGSNGEGALTRAYGRNVVAASEVSDSDRRMLPR